MIRSVCATLTLSLVALAATPRVAQAKKAKLAVMTIADSTRSLGTQLLDGLTDALRGKLAASGRFIVIDKSRQAAALRKLVKAQKKASYKKCYSSKCQIPLGQALAADTILRTKVTRVGSTLLLNAELVDLAKEAVTGAAQASLRARPRRGRDDRLLRAVGDIAYKLTGGASGSKPPTMPTNTSAGSEPDSVPPVGEDDDAGAAAAAAQAEADRQAAERTRAQSEASRYAAERRRVLAQQRYGSGSDRRRRRSRTTLLIYGWGAIGAGAVAAALGVYYLTAKVSAAKDQADLATSPGGIDSALDEAKSARTTGFVMLGLGGAAAAVGTVLLMLAPSLKEPKKVGALRLQKLPTATPTLGGGGLVSWGGRF